MLDYPTCIFAFLSVDSDDYAYLKRVEANDPMKGGSVALSLPGKILSQRGNCSLSKTVWVFNSLI